MKLILSHVALSNCLAAILSMTNIQFRFKHLVNFLPGLYVQSRVFVGKLCKSRRRIKNVRCPFFLKVGVKNQFFDYFLACTGYLNGYIIFIVYKVKKL